MNYQVYSILKTPQLCFKFEISSKTIFFNNKYKKCFTRNVQYSKRFNLFLFSYDMLVKKGCATINPPQLILMNTIIN